MSLLLLFNRRPPPPPPILPPPLGSMVRGRRVNWRWVAAWVLIVLLLGFIVLRIIGAPTKAIIPGVEVNQGLLSLLALLVALAIAVYENRRALRAGEEFRHEYVDQVVAVIDHMLTFTGAAEQQFQAGSTIEQAVASWQRAVVPPRFLMEALRMNPPRDAILAIEVSKLWTGLQMHPAAPAGGDICRSPAEMIAWLTQSRTAIMARR